MTEEQIENISNLIDTPRALITLAQILKEKLAEIEAKQAQLVLPIVGDDQLVRSSKSA